MLAREYGKIETVSDETGSVSEDKNAIVAVVFAALAAAV